MDNDLTERKIREAACTLSVSGRAVLFLSAWGILKMLHNLLFDDKFALFREQLRQQDVPSRALSVALIFLLITAADWFYFYVGFSALAEARGRKRGVAYTVVAFVLMLATAWSMVSDAADWWAAKSELAYLASALVGLISLLITGDLWRSAVELRRLNRQLKKEKEAARDAA